MLYLPSIVKTVFMRIVPTILCVALGFALAAFPFSEGRGQGTFVLQAQTLSNPDNVPAPVHPLPTERQLKWHEMEFYAFFHYGMNTYTGLEWGSGGESPDLFAPTAMPDARQWLETAKAAGMRGGIAVAKHHDGFCLWPTATTEYNCTASANPYARQLHLPRDFAQAARELGMGFGFYVSPWDRNSAYYGQMEYVTDVFFNQCLELARIGAPDQFELWLDGANGGSGYYGGANETRTISSVYYDIPNLKDTLHGLVPRCVLWGVGGEARFIGNERGEGAETNWCMSARGLAGAGNTASGNEDGWIWFPGESDAKVTDDGWFWHEGEQLKSAEELFTMYLETVGRNCNLILNLPPDRSGRLPEATVERMEELGQMLKAYLGTDLAPLARATASNVRKDGGGARTYSASNLNDGDKETYWAADDGVTAASLVLEWPTVQQMRYVVLQEYIRLGQRVRRFRVETSLDGANWTRRAEGATCSTVGYKRIVPLSGSTSEVGEGFPARFVRIVLEDCRACPLIHTVEVY